MLKLSKYFTQKNVLGQVPKQFFSKVFQSSQSKSKTLFIFPNESHILSQHMKNWGHKDSDHTIR